MTHYTFARPSPLTLVEAIPEPDETLARKIVELLARSKTVSQSATTGDVDG